MQLRERQRRELTFEYQDKVKEAVSMGSSAYDSHGVQIGEAVQDRRDDRGQLKLGEADAVLLHSRYTAHCAIFHDDLCVHKPA